MSAITSTAKIINQINAFSRGLSTATDVAIGAADLITKVDRGFFRGAAVVSRSCLFITTAVDIITQLAGVSANASRNIKGVELLVRVLDFPVNLLSNVENLHVEKTAASIIRFLEKGLVGPLLGIVRTGCELSARTEICYLKDYEKDPTAQRPIYDYDENGDRVIVGYRPIDPEECKKLINDYENASAGVGTVESITEWGMVEFVYKKIAARIILGRDFRPNHPGNAPVNEVPMHVAEDVAPQNPQQEVDDVKLKDLLDFKKYRTIPEELEDDEVFKRYRCPITQAPIRFPVAERTGGQSILYERDAIAQYLVNSHTSPMTRQPLSMENLIECPMIQNIIDTRLEFHSAQILNYLRTQLDQNLQQEAYVTAEQNDLGRNLD